RVTVRGPGLLKSVTVVPDLSQTITLLDPFRDTTSTFVDSINRPQSTSFEVLSDKPVAVTAFFATVHGTEAFTPIPVEQWGLEYYAASINQFFVFNAIQNEETNDLVIAPAALVVIASENNTDVTIESPTLLAGERIRGVRRTISLNAGQVYQIETGTVMKNDSVIVNDSLTATDLTGTRISATKPIGVVSGNTRTIGSTGTTHNTLPTGPLPSNTVTNAAYEWLHPTSALGHTFIYRQFSPIAEKQSTELVRVFATSPGMTVATITNSGAPSSIPQGSYQDYPSRVFRRGTELETFAVRTDKPAQVFVFTASHSERVPDSSAALELETTSYSSAMAELVPRERWITFGRYATPLYPGGISHYLVLAADSGTTVLLDGQPVVWDSASVLGTTFRHARVSVALGDHSLRAIGGRFTATAFGQRRGYAAYRPSSARGSHDSSAGVAHPTIYLEVLGATYAMPVPGISNLIPPRDSVTITRNDKCGFSIVTLNRNSVTWSSSIIDASVDAGSRNADIQITKTFAGRLHLGFRVQFMPVDPTQDASGSVTVTNDAGQSWTIPYVYRAFTIALTPSTFDLLAIPVGTLQSIPLTLTNQKPFTTSVLDARLRRGDQGFVLQGRNQLVKTLAAGGSFAMTLEFTGASAGVHYVDTLVIYSDCDSMVVPLSARTVPPAPAPVPLITGYDWGTRRVGSINDTLSFISNAGTLPFTIERVELVGNAANAFALIDPMASGDVASGGRTTTGIRFQPNIEGSYVAEILLITTDGDSAKAELRGASLLARIDVPDIAPIALCVGRDFDTAVTITATGTMPTLIDSFVVTATANVRVELDTAWMNLPLTLAVGESLPLRMKLVGVVDGAFDFAVVAVAAATGDSVAHVSGTVQTCVVLGIA
ncbi:MAG: IgGFc-binding protein, partial [bacterium]|nr:IgGFc-binding protein [Candidatus Kapabacteria bacterium]